MFGCNRAAIAMKNHQRIDWLSNPWIALGLIALVSVIIYSNIYQAPFVFDDVQQIEKSMKIRQLSKCLSPEQLFSPRPIAELTFALNYRFGGLNVFGYHLVNVLIHILNGFLVYFLGLTFFRRLSRPHVQNRDHSNNHDNVEPGNLQADRSEKSVNSLQSMIDHRSSTISLMALFAALIFIAHPLQTQAVTYIIQRHTSLAATFYFLSVAFYMRARILQQDAGRPESGRTGSGGIPSGFRLKPLGLYVLCVICCILAFLSKQNTASLPGAILLIEYILFDRTWQGWRRKLAWFAPAFFIIGVFILYVSGIFRGGVEFGSLLEDVSSILRAHGTKVDRWVYFCTQLNVIVIYIRLLFLPAGQNLDYMYPFKTGFFDGYTPAAFLLLVALAGVGIWQIKRRPAISFGIFWFFITLSIESSFFPIIDALFEHRLYLPMFGFAIAISYIIWTCFSVRRFWRIGISILILAALGSATYLRNRTYESKLRIWADVASKSPQNFRAYYNLGNALYKEGKPYDAIRNYSEALRIEPDFILAHINLGVVLTEVGRLDDAVSHLSEAMRMRPSDVKIQNNLGHALTMSGRLDDAVRHLSKAVRHAPKFAEAHNNLGIALAQQGNLTDAMAHFSKAAAIEPHNAKIQGNLGQAFMLQGDLPKAARHYSEAVRIDPGYAEAHYHLGVVRVRQGDLDSGIDHLSLALKLRPGFTEARQELNRALRSKFSNDPAYQK